MDVSILKVELLTKDTGAVRGDGVVTPSGYFIIPVYDDSGSFVIRVKSPAGWHFCTSFPLKTMFSIIMTTIFWHFYSIFCDLFRL